MEARAMAMLIRLHRHAEASPSANDGMTIATCNITLLCLPSTQRSVYANSVTSSRRHRIMCVAGPCQRHRKEMASGRTTSSACTGE